MKHLLLTTIAAVVLVGCGPSVDIWTGAQTGNIEAVKQHLADGVDVNSKSDIGRTPLDVAIAFKQPLITDLLRKHGGKTRDELKAAESIVVAVELGNIEAVKQHLNDGTEVNAKGGTGRTPLHWAAIEGHKGIAELLIAEGADVNAKTKDGKTPLDEAVNPFYNKTEIANLIRKHGGKHGTIHSAVGGGDVEAAKEFLAAGADVNVKDKRGFTSFALGVYFRSQGGCRTANRQGCGCECDEGWWRDSFVLCVFLGSRGNRRTTYRQGCGCECEGCF